MTGSSRGKKSLGEFQEFIKAYLQTQKMYKKLYNL